MLTDKDESSKKLAFFQAIGVLNGKEFVGPESPERRIEYVRDYFENARSFDKFFQQEIVTTRLRFKSWMIRDYEEFKRIYNEVVDENSKVTYREALNHSLKVLRHLERSTEAERTDLAGFLSNYNAKIPRISVWDKVPD